MHFRLSNYNVNLLSLSLASYPESSFTLLAEKPTLSSYFNILCVCTCMELTVTEPM